MKVLLSWPRDYIDIEHSGEEVAEILSNLGLPNEGIEYPVAPSSPDGTAESGDVVIDVEVTSNRGDCLGYKPGHQRGFSARSPQL